VAPAERRLGAGFTDLQRGAQGGEGDPIPAFGV